MMGTGNNIASQGQAKANSDDEENRKAGTFWDRHKTNPGAKKSRGKVQTLQHRVTSGNMPQADSAKAGGTRAGSDYKTIGGLFG